MRKIKKGDEVIVISGKDKGKRGAVSKVLPEFMIVVDGINVVKRHTKPNPQAGVAGGIVQKEMPINQCKVNLYNPVTNKPDRVGIRSLEDGTKVRFFKSNGEVVDG
ncbi:MAG: 50S ribosomal protein L24 [Pseudomonadota bacterium]|nr:50S ribosomal protein L24 [Pseudomonadota bacterium]